ncbi:MAG: nuclear transport factor 2 family protein [Candidatus Binatia bacterium]
MSNEQNKALVTKTWQALLGGDPEGALANFSDDVSWWISGTLDGVSGVKKGKQQVLAFLGGVAGAFPKGLKSEIQRVHADGDTVILELVNRGTSATGKAYENEYCFVFDLRGGKIQAIREYVDLEKAKIALAP